MQVTYSYYPGGKPKALTLSYDDGKEQDRRLVDMFNRYGLKGTFHLNSSRFGQEGFVTEEEICSLYAGHEVSLHTRTHPTFLFTPKEVQVSEVVEDRKALERITGGIVNGMSYPMGSFDAETADRLRHLGVVYSRTTIETGRFSLPGDFLQWNPTMHYKRDPRMNKVDLTALMRTGKIFTDRPVWFRDMPLLYIWGHSYEYDEDDSWGMMEEFCQYISGFDSIWFATNLEVYNYITAMKSLRFSAECDRVYNPSAISVWIGVDDEPVEIKGGETVFLG